MLVEKVGSYGYKHTKVDRDGNKETEIKTAIELK
jgi:hypothetical protein